MSANRFGHIFTLTTFGESHGPGLGAVIDGCPAGVSFDEELLRRELARRRPGQNALVSTRQESDMPEIISGVFGGKTLGTPLTMMVRNHDARPEDYKALVDQPRPGHADDTWKGKFGHVDPRGGGRSSGRETVARVMAGAVAQMFLRQEIPELRVHGFSSQIGPHKLTAEDRKALPSALLHNTYWPDQFAARLPSLTGAAAAEQMLLQAKEEGKSYGGIAELWVDGLPAGLGQPVFHKLKGDLASALMSVGAVCGVELGDGFAATTAEGSEFHSARGEQYGGVRGGLSTGERIVLRAAFKPTASVLDVAKKGRHDPCIVPRAIPVLQAMVWLVLADHVLWRRLDQLERDRSATTPR